MPEDIGNLTAMQLAQAFQKGRASPVEAVQASLERVARFDPSVNAFVHVDHAGAVEAANSSARRWADGAPLSAVDGLPVSMKDLTEVAGMPARNGSLLADDLPSETDAPPARMLREAGAVILGKTNTPEFGWKGVTDNRLFGVTRNPWDTRLTPGGSSGGAAAAAALNMGVLHQGGDSGGSIRIPASFTGTFGFKPTFGWTPQWPPSRAPTLSHIGPITRTVEDAVLMLNVIGRYDQVDPYAQRGQPTDWGEELGRGLHGLRIAWSPDLGCASVDADVAARVRQAAERMAALGADVVEIHPGFDSPIKIFQTIWFTASLDLYRRCDADQRECLDPGLVDNALRAEAWDAVDYFRAQTKGAEFTRYLERFNQDYHLLMTPTVTIPPFEAGQEVPPGSGMTDWTEWSPFTYPFNLSQQPAASVPCGFTEAGRPVGFQLAGGKHDDVRVLRAAHAYMEAYPPCFPDAPDDRGEADPMN